MAYFIPFQPKTLECAMRCDNGVNQFDRLFVLFSNEELVKHPKHHILGCLNAQEQNGYISDIKNQSVERHLCRMVDEMVL